MDEKKTTYPPFQESTFVKVFLSFAILAGILAAVGGYIIDPASANPTAVETVVGILSGLTGAATFIMAIVAWVQWSKAKYPKVAIAFAISRVIIPVILFFASIAASVMYVRDNMEAFEEAQATGSFDPTGLATSGFMGIIQWIGIIVSVVYVCWAIYLFTIKQDKK